jgi:cbb3-type cytochrome oxidase subunit 3
MAYHWMWLPITGLYLMIAYFLFNLHGKNNYVHQALGLEK